jgi:hypothetical protein
MRFGAAVQASRGDLFYRAHTELHQFLPVIASLRIIFDLSWLSNSAKVGEQRSAAGGSTGNVGD